MKRCKDCKFWQRTTDCQSGYCRRNPPVYNINIQHGAWPSTGESDWCGEFKPKNK